MYKLMIVDDEPYIVDGLRSLFEDQKEYDFEIYTSDGGENALSIMEESMMDIVISDIRMFGMDGLELIGEIKKKWPSCKTIILSGYSDSDYALEAVNLGADAYILKSDGNSELLSAVTRCVNAIKEDMTNKQFIQFARDSLKTSMPFIVNHYINDLLHGYNNDDETRSDFFHNFNITLDPNKPILIVGGRIDTGRGLDIMPYVDSALSSVLSTKANSLYTNWKDKYLVWFIQPLSTEMYIDSFIRYVYMSLDHIQQKCLDAFNISVSLICGDSFVDWEDLPLAYRKFKNYLSYQLPADQSLITISESYYDDLKVESSRINNHVHSLKSLLMYGSINQYTDYIHQSLTNPLNTKQHLQVISFYHQACEVIIDYLCDSKRLDDYLAEFGDYSLFEVNDFSDASQLENLFMRFGNWVFQSRDENSKSDKIIFSLHKYIDENLSSDLSLSALSKEVFLSPVYLSRLYKQITGDNISDYILNQRIELAKTKLSESNSRVSDIAYACGFESAAHFTRTFKKLVGLTPQEYRTNN